MNSRNQKGFFFLLFILPFYGWKISGTPILEQLGTEESLFIEGGNDVKPYEFPWQVSLRSALDFHFCGGVIIDPRTVLTTASCAELVVVPYYTTVIAGSLYLHNNNDSESRKQLVVVTSVHNHPSYAETTDHSNDIAILKVNPAFLLTEEVSPIPRLHDSSLVLTGDGIISGWGSKREEEISLSEKLQKATVDVSLSNHDCQQILDEENISIKVEDSMICIRSQNNINITSVDSCNGDHGGPLIVYDNDSPVLIGLISFGIGCGRPGTPSFCTRISPFIDFIRLYQETGYE